MQPRAGGLFSLETRPGEGRRAVADGFRVLRPGDRTKPPVTCTCQAPTSNAQEQSICFLIITRIRGNTKVRRKSSSVLAEGRGEALGHAEAPASTPPALGPARGGRGGAELVSPAPRSWAKPPRETGPCPERWSQARAPPAAPQAPPNLNRRRDVAGCRPPARASLRHSSGPPRSLLCFVTHVPFPWSSALAGPEMPTRPGKGFQNPSRVPLRLAPRRACSGPRAVAPGTRRWMQDAGKEAAGPVAARGGRTREHWCGGWAAPLDGTRCEEGGARGRRGTRGEGAGEEGLRR